MLFPNQTKIFLTFSDTLPLLRRFIKEYGKLNVTTALTDISITCTDYDFLEFILSSQSVITKSADYDFYTNWLGDGLIMSTGKSNQVVLLPFSSPLPRRRVDALSLFS